MKSPMLTLWRLLPKQWSALLLVVLALVTGAPSAGADGPDRFEPAAVDVTLAPGESTTVRKTLHLDALPAKADICIAIDTTGSMGPAIAQAKAEAGDIVTEVQAEIPGARFCVIDFKDYPFSPYGGSGDYAYLLRAPLTSSAAVVQAAIGTMSASGGGDGPESYNRVFFEAYSDPALVYDPQALKFLVVLGDAPPHDPTQTVAPACGDRPPVDPGRDNVAGTGDDLETETTIAGLNANDITLLMIHYATGFIGLACYEQLAAAAGGDAFASGGGEDLSKQIVDAVKAQATSIEEVRLVVSGECPPIDISFNPPNPPPYGPFTAPVDIPFDEIIEVPSGTPPDTYTCTVTAVVDGAARATERVTVTVRPEADKEVTDVILDGGEGFPNREGRPLTFVSRDPDSRTTRWKLIVEVSTNPIISVVSVERNNGPQATDSRVSFLASIDDGHPPGHVEGAYVQTVTSDLLTCFEAVDPTFPLRQSPENRCPTTAKIRGDGDPATVESDLHFQKFQEVRKEQRILRFFKLHCTEGGRHTITFYNKAEPKEPTVDPNLNNNWWRAVLELTCVTPGKVTGGGQIEGDPAFSLDGNTLLTESAAILSPGGSAEANFGFVIMFESGDPAPKGNLLYKDHVDGTRIKATSYATLAIFTGPCGPDTRAEFTGTAEVNGSPENFTVVVDDCGEPGSSPGSGPDTFSIDTDTYDNSGLLLRGNIQIHKSP